LLQEGVSILSIFYAHLKACRKDESMCLPQVKIKKFLVTFATVISVLSFPLQNSFADSVAIKGAMKIQRMGGYVIFINYQTHDKWTDSLLFKVHCKFERGEFTFTSSSLNNIEKGWHKTQIVISDVIKKRYGSLREYKIDLYENGVLIDTKKNY